MRELYLMLCLPIGMSEKDLVDPSLILSKIKQTMPHGTTYTQHTYTYAQHSRNYVFNQFIHNNLCIFMLKKRITNGVGKTLLAQVQELFYAQNEGPVNLETADCQPISYRV